MKTVAANRKAFHLYEILEKLEAGISLKGCEVKSIRSGKIDIKDGFVSIQNGEALLFNVRIPQYHQSTNLKYDPARTRKLLLNKQEIKRLLGKTTQKGFSVVPVEVYFNKRGIAKVQIALVKGKKQYDKKETKKRRDIDREMRREFADKFR